MADNLNIGRRTTGNSISGRLDKERSRMNFRDQLSDERVARIRKYARSLINSWTPEEKVAFVKSYGEGHLLPNHYNEELVNTQVVETMIINLPEAELNKIVDQAEYKQARLMSDIKANDKKSISRGRVVSAAGSRSPLNYINRNISAPLSSSIRNMDDPNLGISNFFASRVAFSGSQALERELAYILQDTSKGELGLIAQACGIDYTVGQSHKDVKKMIINKCVMYVAVLLGKFKGMPPVLDAEHTSGIEQLIAQTSLSWVVGLPALTAKEIAAKKKKAKEARKEQEARMKVINSKAAKLGSKEFSQISGYKGKSKKEQDIIDALENSDQGFLKTYTDEQLFAKADSLGITYDIQKITRGELKMRIYQKLSGNIKEIQKLEKVKAKFQKDMILGKTTNMATRKNISNVQSSIDALTTAMDIKGIDNKTKSAIGNYPDGNGGTPLVKFDAEGKIKTDAITYAVPVYVVGHGTVGSQAVDLEKEEQEEIELGSDLYSLSIKYDVPIPEKLDKKTRKKFAKEIVAAKKKKEGGRLIDKIKDKYNSVKDNISNMFNTSKNTNDIYNFKKYANDSLEGLFRKAIGDIDSDNDLGKYGDKLGIESNKLDEIKAKLKTLTYSAYIKFKDDISNTSTKEDVAHLNEEIKKFFKDTEENSSTFRDTIVNGNFRAFSDESISNLLNINTKKENKVITESEKIKTEVKIVPNKGLSDSDKNEMFKATPVFVVNYNDLLLGNQKIDYDAPVSLNKDYVDNIFSKANSYKNSLLETKKYTKLSTEDGFNLNRLDLIGKDSPSAKAFTRMTTLSGGKGRTLTPFYNDASKRVFAEARVNSKNITPVWITNGFTQYLNETTEDGFRDLLSIETSTYSFLTTSLPILFGGLQQVGMSVNAASATSLAVMGKEMLGSVADTAIDLLTGLGEKEVTKYATGGYGRAGNNISQFITGDSLNNKPNEELVTVDWSSKKYNVKPMNSNGNVKDVGYMNSNERNKAMSVTLSNALVKFRGTLKDTEENFDNFAVKVYPVTPGINDKIEIGGTSVSLMELIYSMYGSLTSIESLIAADVQVNKLAASKPSINSTSGGEATSTSPFSGNIDVIARGD